MNAEPQMISANPATGELLGRWPLDPIEDVHRILQKARAAQPGWAETSVRLRARAMFSRVRDHLVEHADGLAEIISRDNGKTRLDAISTEVLPAAMAASYYCRKAKRFLKPRRLSPANWLLANKSSRIRQVPWGVVGIISPWNYPFGIPFSEVVMGLLTGNAVVLKVSTQTPMVGQALKRCFQAAGLPEGVFAYVNLPGSAAGDAFLEGGLDKIFFTGSVAVGKQLMAKAAQTLTPLCLELGGNDPMLVCPDADLQRAAAGAVWAGMSNCGQSCASVERIYVHADVYEPFLQMLGEKISALRIGPDTDHHIDVGAMTTSDQMDVVRRHLQDALDRGATIHVQSACPQEGPGNYFPATVLSNVDHSMRVMREETFGPVVGVMRVDDMDQAVELANGTRFGLTGSVWSRDRKKARRLAARIQAGVVTINDHLLSHGLAETPWGGFKESGLGRTHGALGFAEMTQPQCIVDDRMPGVKKNLWWHPHGPEVYQGIKGILDLLYAKRFSRRVSGLCRLLKIVPRTFKA